VLQTAHQVAQGSVLPLGQTFQLLLCGIESNKQSIKRNFLKGIEIIKKGTVYVFQSFIPGRGALSDTNLNIQADKKTIAFSIELYKPKRGRLV
jgi:hypothetical protein